MARQILIAGNWKMNKGAADGAQLIKDLKAQFGSGCSCCCSGAKKPEVLVCPTFTTLSAVVAEAQGSCLLVGAQNIHWADQGAFTGEISGAMLKECGVTHVITLGRPSTVIMHEQQRPCMQNGPEGRCFFALSRTFITPAARRETRTGWPSKCELS